MVLKEKKVKCYREFCFKFGILTLCYLISYYEDKQLYEECNIILEAINGLKKDFMLDLPTHYNKKTEQQTVDLLFEITGSPGTIFFKNLPYYAMEVIEEIEKLK